MVKLAQSTIKYQIEAEFETDGIVEKPDIIGAIFGQTEGLLGADLELRELQRTGRIGRIDVDVSSSSGKSRGKISIPSSLDSSETALIAAALETIERIGPCNSVVKLLSLKDVRSIKRDYVMDRAKEIMQWLADESSPNSSNMSETVKESIRAAQLQEYEGLPCGPDITMYDEIIVVEGRADVLNLLRNGVKNVIAMDGNRIPAAILRLSREKVTTLFTDGDRGGELIIKEFLQLGELDYVVQAPQGKEVEDLTKKEIFKTLREKQTIEEYRSQPKAKELKEFLSNNMTVH